MAQTAYHIAAYSLETDDQIETREVGQEYFGLLRELLGEAFDPHQDVYLIEGEVAAELEHRFGCRLDPSLAHYLEQFSA